MGESVETDRLVLVTGAASGIGAAVAHALCATGQRVALLDIDPRGLEQTVSACAMGDAGPRAYEVDVTNRNAVVQAVERIERELGPLTGLVHAAGVLRTGPVGELSEEDWEACMAVNARGVCNVLTTVAIGMRRRGRGAIVTVASNAARTPRVGMAAYCASKAAAVAFTRVLGLELAGSGLRCNVVSPGSTDTPMQRALWAGPEDAQAVIAGNPQAFKLGIPLGRIAEAKDVAQAVLFLLSPAARHVTMQELVVDGGATF